MASSLFLTLSVILVTMAGSRGAHQVTFNGGRTLPQETRDLSEKARDLEPQIRALKSLMEELELRDTESRASECDDACIERRAEELLPAARNFLSEISKKVTRSLEEQQTADNVQRAVRGINEAFESAKRKRENIIFGSPMASARRSESERGVVKEGLHETHYDRQGKRAFDGLKAALNIRSVVDKRAMAKRKAEEILEVRALVDNLEARSQKRAAEASRLGMRAVEDLKEAMKLEKRADEVKSVIEKEQAKRVLDNIKTVKERAVDITKTENLKRGMEEIKKISKDLEKKELDQNKNKRDEIFGDLKTLATRILQERASSSKTNEEQDDKKREFTGKQIAEGMAQARRSVDEQKSEKRRELAQMKIAESVEAARRALMKREFQEREVEKVREAASMKIAEEIASAKRALEKRTLEERELAAKRFSEKMDILKRTVEESKAKRALDTMEKYRRALEAGEQKHLEAVRALEGLQTALEKRELELKTLKEDSGMRAVRDIDDNVEKALLKRTLQD